MAAKGKNKILSGMTYKFSMVSQKLMVVMNLTILSATVPWSIGIWRSTKNWSRKRKWTQLKRSKRKELVMIWGDHTMC